MLENRDSIVSRLGSYIVDRGVYGGSPYGGVICIRRC
jgi:hypothetical protein